ncbi:hypothetical protein FKM82_007548 [Ascaphus truei]
MQCQPRPLRSQKVGLETFSHSKSLKPARVYSAQSTFEFAAVGLALGICPSDWLERSLWVSFSHSQTSTAYQSVGISLPANHRFSGIVKLGGQLFSFC